MGDPHDRYKVIFDLCDEDKDGFVDLDHFTELAKKHFGSEDLDLEVVSEVVNLLDPEGKRLISFEDFCRGVDQIVEVQRKADRSRLLSEASVDSLLPLASTADSFGEKQETETTDKKSAEDSLSNQDNQIDSSSSGRNFVGDVGGVPDGNGISLVSQSNSIVQASQAPGSEDEGDSIASGRSSEINENSRPEITDEDNHEDLWEAESEADGSDQGLNPVSRQKRGVKKDLLSRSHRKACSNKKLAIPSALASQLQRSSRDVTPSSTRRSSLGSDEIFDDIDGNFQDLDGRVKFLEKQLLRLTETQVETNTKQAKLKDENGVLVSKIVYLEEQLRDMEVRALERITQERRNHQEIMARRDREKSEEVVYLTQRLQRIEEEYDSLKEDAAKLRQEIQKLREEKVDLQERMLDKQELYNSLYDDNEQLKGKYLRQEELYQRERLSMGQLLDEVGKELEELRKYKIEVETGVRSPGDGMSVGSGRCEELQGEIHKLKEALWKEWHELMKENRDLQSSNEDLTAQLMSRCVEEGKSLLQDGGPKSLAEELEHLTKEELMEKLRQEQHYNLRLKQYIDRMLMTILEKNPSILEIKTE